HRSVRKIYTEQLLRKGDISPEEAERWLDQFQAKLQEAFDRTKEQEAPPSQRDPLWTDEEVTGYQKEPSPDTSITDEVLAKIRATLNVPEGFTPHPKLKPVLAKRQAMSEGKEPMDWGAAEFIAFGSLLLDGFRVRLSGQDVGRGTFSHRHAILFDYVTGNGIVPLNTLARDAKPANVSDPVVVDNALTRETNDPDAEVSLAVYDSLLSEYGVLGFEYGYSVSDPGALVVWEAQFGDFMNGAQIIIDQFLSSAEEKWGQHSGLVMILRLEQFYPFPQPMIVEALKGYPNASELVWVQEEPRNMGAWPFLHERLTALHSNVRYVGRPVAAAPATGSHHRHEEQQKALVDAAISG